MTVFVHNAAWSSRREAEPWLSDANETDLDDWTWWNLWRVRAAPFRLLEDGDLIVLLNSWPGGGEFSWLVEARDVLKDEFNGWEDATRALAPWSGRSLREVRREPYTAAKKALNPHVLLAWRARPVRPLGIPKPDDFIVGRNGWVITDADALRAHGVDLDEVEGPEGGQLSPSGGRYADEAARRRAVELRAVEVALAWCRERGWTDAHHVGDEGRAWDIEALDQDGSPRYVEVKGTTGEPGTVVVTRNEVDAALDHGVLHSLVHVHSIRLGRDDAGALQASGGVLISHDPWQPRTEELRVISYDWGRPLP